ncbi:hypothetical protein FJY68_12950 [candidate division WOR-3 bacterium]|uniref:Uncharacterized protein n=1 Tax=candidate division WOR-3 bacterium TaxID=2052148 RepID=A0A937XGL5_UNCW3|nr:hypothetical protein [candidate division WOR-3 bacterium]
MRGTSRAALLALAVVALLPSLGVAQYAPKWRVGDWWIVKTLWERQSSLSGVNWEWKYTRYDVAGIEKVGHNDCYVVETRGDRQPDVRREEAAGIVLYVRTDNWRLVRMELARYDGGKRVAPDVFDTPDGRFGPFIGEPRLPRFPLQLMSKDTAFKTEDRIHGVADLREISCPADPAMVERLLAEGDALDTRVVRPSAAVYLVRNDLAGNAIPGPRPGEREITQSLQLWSDDLPWRPFEELVSYRGPNRTRRVTDRSWLIAVGEREK